MAEQTLSEIERRRKQLQLVNYGIVASGVVTLLVAVVSTQPHGILFFGLGALALAMVVFEYTQNAAFGLSFGLLTGSFGVWVWPRLDGESYLVLGGMLVVVGIVNAVITPYFYQLGAERAEG